MTRTHLLLGTACALALTAFACSQTGPGTLTGSGGSTGMGTGGSQSQGGATGSGGNTGAGGTTATSLGGLTGQGQGGSVAGGNSLGGGTAAGASSLGGSSAGGSSAAGANSMGGATALGGATGTGGVTGTGGAAAGGMTGGTTPKDIVPDLVGYYWEGTCVGTRDAGGHNCPLDDKGSGNCPNTGSPDQLGITRDKVINVKGVMNQPYTLNIEVRGVLGTRCYTGGKRAATAPISDDGDNNWWYVGGTPSDPTSWWNTYEIHVSPATGDKDVYYLNGSAEGSTSGPDCQREASYLVRYKASFKVLGGGKITLRLHDVNCQAQQNCGSNTTASSQCQPRNVDLSGLSAPPPAGFVQPPNNQLSKTYYPQWAIIDVLSVTSP